MTAETDERETSAADATRGNRQARQMQPRAVAKILLPGVASIRALPSAYTDLQPLSSSVDLETSASVYASNCNAINRDGFQARHDQTQFWVQEGGPSRQEERDERLRGRNTEWPEFRWRARFSAKTMSTKTVYWMGESFAESSEN